MLSTVGFNLTKASLGADAVARYKPVEATSVLQDYNSYATGWHNETQRI